MGFSDAIRHYYEYEKWKFITVAIVLSIAILSVVGLIWWFFWGAPQWNTFVENLASYFTELGSSTYLSFANLQSYFANYWIDFIMLIAFIGCIIGIFYTLAKVRRHRKKILLGLGVAAGIIGFSLTTHFAIAQGYIENPFKGAAATPDPVITHHYILYTFNGKWDDGWWWDESTLQVTSATATLQTAAGQQDNVRWQIVSHSWTIQEDGATAIAKVYAKIIFTDGSEWGWEQLWQGKYAPNSNFDFTLRFDVPTGKTPKTFIFKIEELDYTWIFHHGYKVVFNNQYSL